MPEPAAAILGCAGPDLSRDEAAFFRETDPFGFILFARNVTDPDQLRRLTGDLRSSVARDALILVDQEGGRVQRLRAPHWREWLPPYDHVARSGAAVSRSIYLRYRLIAEELRGVGIDVNCAPLADIAATATHPFLRNRCFGEAAETVISAARAAAEGLADGGVLPVIKHLPGHGRAEADSHQSLPRITAPLEVLSTHDFRPFRTLRYLPMAMTAHVVLEAVDALRPATQSPAVIRLVRDEIGFDGLLMTDDLSMQALSGTLGERTGAAIAAGCDVALHCNGDRAEMADVMAHAGRLGGASARRAKAALSARRAALPIDSAALAAELDALMQGAAIV
jgi:beta-N-acetylhexosaminidase